MRIFAYRFAFAFLFLSVVPAFADDQEKAEKELRKVTAMATDFTGRRVVSQTISDVLKVDRPQLIQQRREMNLNYGALFIVYHLTTAGVKMEDVATELKAGKSVIQIANTQHLNWKQLSADAKKLNGKIEDGIYKHFLNDAAEKAREKADKYDPGTDWTATDNDGLSKQDIAAAQDTYLLWRDRASQGRKDKAIGELDENVARQHDHIRDEVPRPGDSSTTPPK